MNAIAWMFVLMSIRVFARGLSLFATQNRMMFSALLMIAASVCLRVSAADSSPDSGYTREQLQPLTKFRQQHQRTVDGRLCAAAFVQARKAYTGCTDAPDPSGMSGRPWCYVEPQVDYFAVANCLHACDKCNVELLNAGAAWNYCGARCECAVIMGFRVRF